MPRIPLSNKAGFIQHRADAVHMQGAPGMDFGMDKGRAMVDFGKTIQNAGGKIVDHMLEFKRQQTDTENKLAAADAQNLYRSINAELTQRMTANPGSYKDFEAWAREADQKYEEAVKPIQERMSGGFRKLFDAEMTGERTCVTGERLRIATQASVTAQLDLANAQFKDCLSRGDEAGARAIIASHTGTLYSDEKAKQMQITVDQQIPYYNAKRAIESGLDEQTVEELEKRDPKYAKMPETLRDQLIRYGRGVTTDKNQNWEYQFAVSLKDGNCPWTKEKLTEAHEKKEINDRQYLRGLQMLQNRDEGIAKLEEARRKAWQTEYEIDLKEGKSAWSRETLQTAHEKKEISDDQYLFALGKIEEKEAKQKQIDNEQKKRADDLEKAFKFNLTMTNFSSDPAVNEEQKRALKEEASERFAGDNEKKLSVYGAIDAASTNALKGGDEFATPEGQVVLQFITKNYRGDNGEYKGLRYNGIWDWSATDSSTEFQQARFYEVIERGREMIGQGKSAAEVIASIKGQVNELNDGKLASLIENGGKYRSPNIRQQFKEKLPKENKEGTTGKLQDGRTGTLNGKKVVFENGKLYYAK